jgi:hypothetical protein
VNRESPFHLAGHPGPTPQDLDLINSMTEPKLLVINRQM